MRWRTSIASQLFALLETKDALIRLLDLTGAAEGVQIFIGAENALFSLAGCSMIIAPYSNSQQKVVGAIGVIGPTRIAYARIIPMVDSTADRKSVVSVTSVSVRVDLGGRLIIQTKKH